MKTKSEHLGMWLFLASEVLLFGVLIFLFEVMRAQNNEAFEIGSRSLHFIQGTLNTVILLTSSYLLALGLLKRQRSLLLLTFILGACFLGVKGHEYLGLFNEGRLVLSLSPGLPKGEKLFYSFYGFMTMLHLLHVFIGMILVLIVWWSIERRPDEEVEENVGLYWHFVDLVWVFLYPLFYLLGR